MKISMDPNDWEIGEIIDWEEATGVPISEFRAGGLSGKALQVTVWIALRRENPDFTLEEARKLKLRELEFASPPVDAGPIASPNGSRPSATSTAASRRKRSGV